METKTETGYRWAVVVAYDGPYGDRGEVKSRHRTYDAAVNRIRRLAPGGAGNWLAIRENGEITILNRLSIGGENDQK